MRTILALLLLWSFGIVAIIAACTLAILIYRVAYRSFWNWRFHRAAGWIYPEVDRPLIDRIRKSAAKER